MFEKSFPQFSSQINDLLVEAHDRHIGINNAVKSSCCIQRHIDTSMGSGVGIAVTTEICLPGSIIFDSDIVSGDIRYDDRATPPGIFTLYYKKSPDVLRGEKKPDGTYEYETQVTYWMPFVYGQGLHDASWQTSFGGDTYKTKGSHGCINLPPDQAKIIYETIDKGYPILLY